MTDVVGVTGAHARIRDPRLWALLLALAYFGAAAYGGTLRPVGGYGKETDFYARFAPDADRLARGEFPKEGHTGPGYALLLLGASQLTHDHFTSGKLLSAVTGALAFLGAWALFRRCFGDRAALVGGLAMLASPDVLVYSMQATTDIPFLALCLAAILALIGSGLARASLAGVLTGLAYLVRYNAVFLLPTALLWFGVLDPARGSRASRASRVAVYLLASFLTVAPWLWLNAVHRGSPFYTTNYQNIAAAAYYSPGGEDPEAFRTRFHSFGDVVRYDPARLGRHYVRTLGMIVANSLGAPQTLLPVGLGAVAGTILVLRGFAAPPGVLVPVSVVLYILPLALVHWERRYFFYVAVCYAGLAGHALVTLGDALRARWRLGPALSALGVPLLVLLALAPGTVFAAGQVTRMLRHQPLELLAAAAYLTRAAPADARLMARKPHLAYLSRRPWVYLPEVASLDELHDVLRREPAAYLLCDRLTSAMRPALAFLATPQDGIPWLQPVYADRPHELVIYRVTAFDGLRVR